MKEVYLIYSSDPYDTLSQDLMVEVYSYKAGAQRRCWDLNNDPKLASSLFHYYYMPIGIDCTDIEYAEWKYPDVNTRPFEDASVERLGAQLKASGRTNFDPFADEAPGFDWNWDKVRSDLAQESAFTPEEIDTIEGWTTPTTQHCPYASTVESIVMPDSGKWVISSTLTTNSRTEDDTNK